MRNERIVEELEQIRNKHGGVLRPVDVVEFAKNPNTALHEQFTWDDTEAASRYRIWQAREVIRVSVTILPQAPQQPHRVYVSLKSDRTEPGGGYRPVVDVLSNEQLRRQLLSQSLEEAIAWQRKYQSLSELAPVFAEIEKLANAA